MHIHILGICGTFMGSLAQLARELGHQVTGSDANVYPPMSTQLEQAGIAIVEGWDPAQLEPAPDLVVIGNAMSRGNECVEAVLDRGLPYTSGPQWLCDHLLQGRWVLAAAGTHGKTTTASMLAWILEYAGMQPGFLIGGVPSNFDVSARLGGSSFFVVEADEYDSAFFDKRSKFVHYRPRTVILNNLEFDHADIFPDLAAIERQFHHFIRTIPASGMIIRPANDDNLNRVIDQGCWSEQQLTAIDSADNDSTHEPQWQAQLQQSDGSIFDLCFVGEAPARVNWEHSGNHNVANALAAAAAARHVGVTPATSAQALSLFQGVKRRMECLLESNSLSIYDDFAHHPTAIATTLEGLRNKVGDQKIIALIEPRSNTMRLGTHSDQLLAACQAADDVLWFDPQNLDWDLQALVHSSRIPAKSFQSIDEMIEAALLLASTPCHVVVMSNGSFHGLREKIVVRARQWLKQQVLATEKQR